MTGTWIDETSGIYVGWTARENSFSDGMPVQNERGDITLVFSGEEYPEPNAVHSLKERGHQFKPEGPSYLVHLYEEDPSFPKSLNGRFQGLAVRPHSRSSDALQRPLLHASPLLSRGE